VRFDGVAKCPQQSFGAHDGHSLFAEA